MGWQRLRRHGKVSALTVEPQLDPSALLELGQDSAQCFFCPLPDEVWVCAEGLYQPAQQEQDKLRTRGRAEGATATIRGIRRSA